jgi:hypothetical protein
MPTNCATGVSRSILLRSSFAKHGTWESANYFWFGCPSRNRRQPTESFAASPQNRRPSQRNSQYGRRAIPDIGIASVTVATAPEPSRHRGERAKGVAHEIQSTINNRLVTFPPKCPARLLALRGSMSQLEKSSVLATESHFRFAAQSRPLNECRISSVWADSRTSRRSHRPAKSR